MIAALISGSLAFMAPVGRTGAALMMADRVFDPTNAKGGIPVLPDKTALLFIEYQNEFTSVGGKLHDAVKDVMESNNMLVKSALLAQAARVQGVKVFHAPIMFKEDASDNPNKALGILAGCAENKFFTEGSWNADFHPMMAPQPVDVVIRGKKGLDAFPGTDLEQQLIANGIETVVLGGFLTNCCVESTMRTAYEKGFNVITLVDATATTSEEGQAVTGGSYTMFSTPMTVDEFSQMVSIDLGEVAPYDPQDLAVAQPVAQPARAARATRAARTVVPRPVLDCGAFDEWDPNLPDECKAEYGTSTWHGQRRAR